MGRYLEICRLFALALISASGGMAMKHLVDYQPISDCGAGSIEISIKSGRRFLIRIHTECERNIPLQQGFSAGWGFPTNSRASTPKDRPKDGYTRAVPQAS